MRVCVYVCVYIVCSGLRTFRENEQKRLLVCLSVCLSIHVWMRMLILLRVGIVLCLQSVGQAKGLADVHSVFLGLQVFIVTFVLVIVLSLAVVRRGVEGVGR